MSIEKALREELQTISGLDNKIFPINAPESTPAPYLIYRFDGLEKSKSLGGYLELKERSCEINILATSATSLKTISDAVVAKLETFDGKSIGSELLLIQEIEFDDLQEFYEVNTKQYRYLINIKIAY